MSSLLTCGALGFRDCNTKQLRYCRDSEQTNEGRWDRRCAQRELSNKGTVADSQCFVGKQSNKGTVPDSQCFAGKLGRRHTRHPKEHYHHCSVQRPKMSP